MPVLTGRTTSGLGGWITKQGARHAQGALDPGRRNRLEALPGWTWEPRDAAWEEAIEKLQQFVRREGHARVPRSHQEDGFRLGSWVGDRRGQHTKGALDPGRRNRLEALPGWTWEPRDAAWEEAIEKLPAIRAP